MRHTLSTFLTILLTMLGMHGAWAGELTVGELDYRNDRLYFPVGEEAQVYEHALYVITHGGDSVYTGHIEHSWRGVSVGNLTGGALDSLKPDGLVAKIETADIDSLSPLILGTDLAGLELWSGGYDSSRVEIREYDDRLLMLEDFQSDLLDGLISFEALSPRPEGVSTIMTSAPFIVVMIPHVGREINYQGQLTTSFYYRFDRSRLVFSFDGDQLTMTNRFEADSLHNRPSHRLYDFDPTRGRQLFEQMTFAPTSVAFYSSHPALDGLTHYFADIVSRDRCSVELVDHPRSADVSLAFVPVSKSLPSVTIYSLFHQLAIDTVADRASGEHVRRIAAELRYVEAPSRLEDYYRHLRNAGRIMIEDLGLFPLFRPTVFVHTHRRLQQLSFDNDNLIDLESSVLLELPQPSEGDAP